jgi:hypothetical protein
MHAINGFVRIKKCGKKPSTNLLILKGFYSYFEDYLPENITLPQLINKKYFNSLVKSYFVGFT